MAQTVVLARTASPKQIHMINPTLARILASPYLQSTDQELHSRGNHQKCCTTLATSHFWDHCQHFHACGKILYTQSQQLNWILKTLKTTRFHYWAPAVRKKLKPWSTDSEYFLNAGVKALCKSFLILPHWRKLFPKFTITAAQNTIISQDNWVGPEKLDSAWFMSMQTCMYLQIPLFHYYHGVSRKHFGVLFCLVITFSNLLLWLLGLQKNK